MIKIKFEYTYKEKTFVVKASAKKVTPYTAQNLVLRFLTKEGQSMDIFFNSKVFEEIEELAIEKLHDHKMYPELRF